jgi:deoxyhypusine monooxygenase
LGAIGCPKTLNILQKYQSSELIELAETCELAVKRIQYIAEGGKEPRNIYGSVDPTPPSIEKDVEKLKNILFDENKSIYDRYAAMFALRDLNTDESILALAKGTTDPKE